MFASILFRNIIKSSKVKLERILDFGQHPSLNALFSLSCPCNEHSICPNQVKGIDHLKDPRLNKGLAFTLEERMTLGIHGLLAARVRTLEEQLAQCKLIFDSYKSDINKYLYLSEMQERNEKLFYSFVDQNLEACLPIIYTPTVGLACQKFGIVYRRPRGLFITIGDKGHVYNVVRNWPEYDVRAVVMTDGERILGLGDLGAFGMGIPVGKLALYTALAGVKPHQCLPITLDVGTNNKALREDNTYIGLRNDRIRGQEYDDFVDEVIRAIIRRYGQNTLVQFEDFALPNAGRLLGKYRDKYCTFNDDIQGTAAVSVAGLFASTKVTKKPLKDNIFMFLGAGSASNGIAELICQALVQEGMPIAEAREKIFMFDLDGLLTSQRSGGIPEHAKNFTKNLPPEKSFEKAVATVKPTAIIGCSTSFGAFTPKVLKQMAKNAERPVVFALSNPTSKAECTAQEAYDNTEGRCVFASGSPFPPVKFNGKEYRTGQGNNSYIFPGVALGVIAVAVHQITDGLFLTAARTLADCVTQEDLDIGRIYPPLSDLKKVSFKIAMAVCEQAYEHDLATVYPKPSDMASFLKYHIYDMNYSSAIAPEIYKYPPNVINKKT